jgi:hypothetical protein
MERQPRWKENAYNLCMEVYNEIEFAVEKFPAFNSAHEGYAILLEEVDELWDEVKNNKHDDGAKQRKEAIQVAAMAIRFVLDISDKGKHRNEIRFCSECNTEIFSTMNNHLTTCSFGLYSTAEERMVDEIHDAQ